MASRPHRLRALALPCLAALSAGGALAHDLWILPADFRPAVGEVLQIGLRLGHAGAREEAVARDPGRIAAFTAHQGGSVREVVGLEGANPAGLLPLGEAGLLAIAYRSRPALSVLPPEAFERYLAEEGLEGILAERERLGEGEKEGRERYSRSLKALVVVGEGGGGDLPLGLPLELVAAADPSALAGGGDLSLTLFHQGEPLAGALVEATCLDAPGESLRARSDEVGRLTFSLPRSGAWMLSAVHMLRADGDPAVEWRSLWTSLTFSLPES